MLSLTSTSPVRVKDGDGLELHAFTDDVSAVSLNWIINSLRILESSLIQITVCEYIADWDNSFQFLVLFMM